MLYEHFLSRWRACAPDAMIADDAAMTPLLTLRITRKRAGGNGSVIELHTLGDALIKVGDKEIRPTSPLVFAALLYLCVERGRRVSRAALQELLFPDRDERSGAHSMRQLLYKLRQLGVEIRTDNSTVLLLSQVNRDDFSLTCIDDGDQALAMYSRGYLPGYEYLSSAPFARWLEDVRDIARHGLTRLLVSALTSRRELANWPSVERVARAVLITDPLNEEATLALAEASALTGSKAHALELLSQYQRDTGRTDLQLAAGVLKRRISERLWDSTCFTTSAPLIGRTKEVMAFRLELQRSRRGSTRLLLLVGEPGIGKTRLVEENAALATLEGFQVHLVRCQPHFAQRPMSVFLELVPKLLASRGALGISSQSMTELRSLVSTSANSHETPADSRETATRSELLAHAIHDLVDAVANELPLLLAVEDMHWADADSVRELAKLLDHSSTRKLLLACTCRPAEEMTPFFAILDSAVILRMQPLPFEAINELAKFFLRGTDVEPEVFEWLIATASGNPLWLQTLCSHYLRTGQAFSVPDDLMEATRRRVDRLTAGSQRILEYAALLGAHAKMEDIQLLAESPSLAFLDDMQRLENDGLLVGLDQAVRVSHPLVAEAAISRVKPITRRLLHNRVATVLEQRYNATEDVSLLWEVAEHWTQGHEPKKALEFLHRCAKHATKIGRATTALEVLERARPMAVSIDQKKALLHEMMILAKAAGQWRTVFDRSQELFELRGHIDSTSHDDVELLSIESRWMSTLQARAYLDQLLSCAQAEKASNAHRIQAAHLLLRISHELCNHDLGHRAFEAVRPLIGLDQRDAISRTLPIIYHTSFGDRSQAISIAKQLRSELPDWSVGDRFRLGNTAATALCFVGCFEEGIPLFQELWLVARSLGMKEWEFDFGSGLCWAYVTMEEFEEARKWYQRADEIVPLLAGTYSTRRHHSHGVELALHDRKLTEARSRFAALAASSFGESIRAQAYVVLMTGRISLADPLYCPTSEQLKELIGCYTRIAASSSADSETAAVVTALMRANRGRDAADLLATYVRDIRREISPLGPTLRRLSEELRVFEPQSQAGMAPLRQASA